MSDTEGAVKKRSYENDLDREDRKRLKKDKKEKRDKRDKREKKEKREKRDKKEKRSSTSKREKKDKNRLFFNKFVDDAAEVEDDDGEVYSDNSEEEEEDYETREDREFIASDDEREYANNREQEYDDREYDSYQASAQRQQQSHSAYSSDDEGYSENARHQQLFEKTLLEDVQRGADRYDDEATRSYNEELEREKEMQNRSSSQSKFMPKTSDPHLYLIRSKVGKEAQSVFELYKQLRIGQDSNNPYEVYSVFTNPASRGYIYIEAHKKTEVIRLCSAVIGLSGFKAVKVGLNEMIPALVVPEAALKSAGVGGGVQLLKAGTFVRIKSGIYKNDLALVFRTVDGGATAVVKIIPRIDYTQLAAVSLGRGGRGNRGTSVNRPPQDRFDISKARAAGVDYSKVPGRDLLGFSTFIQVKSQHFLDGILYAVMPARSLISELSGMPPTVREIDLFRTGTNTVSNDEETHTGATVRILKEAEQRLQEAIQDSEKYRRGFGFDDENADNGSGSNPTSGLTGRSATAAALEAKNAGYVRGDNIVVISGELKTLEGEIVSVSGDQILMRPTNVEGLPDQTFHRREIGKRFAISERILILQGPLRGTTGMIININDALQTLEVVSDISREHAEVRFEEAVHHVGVIGATGTNIGVKLYDLVTAQGKQGCVVMVAVGRVKLLDMDGTVRTVSISEVQPRVGRKMRAAATDSVGHTIQADDSVIPLSIAELQQISNRPIIALGQTEAYAGKVCTVKHIIHSKLFLHNHTVREHGGMFVIDAGRVRKLTNQPPPSQQNQQYSDAGYGSSASAASASHVGSIGYNARFDPIRGKQVVIIRGTHKGLTARVHSVQGTNDLLVELTARAKRMQISRMDVQLIDAPKNGVAGGRGGIYGQSGSNQAIGLSAKTPMLGSQTPAYPGAMSAGHGSSNISGGRTGVYQGGKTPLISYGGDDEFTPWSLKTPMIGGSNSPIHPYDSNHTGQHPSHGSGHGHDDSLLYMNEQYGHADSSHDHNSHARGDSNPYSTTNPSTNSSYNSSGMDSSSGTSAPSAASTFESKPQLAFWVTPGAVVTIANPSHPLFNQPMVIVDTNPSKISQDNTVSTMPVNVSKGKVTGYVEGYTEPMGCNINDMVPVLPQSNDVDSQILADGIGISQFISFDRDQACILVKDDYELVGLQHVCIYADINSIPK